ncbi:Mitochondrial distribution and morphology protein 10, partial [Ascosphaera acerosa]
MLDFMEYIQAAFRHACSWQRDNSYSSLADTAKAILDFPIPLRLRLNLASLATPHFATSYALGTVGLIDGSVAYLFTTVPLRDTPSRSTALPLRHLVPGYRQVCPADFGLPAWRQPGRDRDDDAFVEDSSTAAAARGAADDDDDDDDDGDCHADILRETPLGHPCGRPTLLYAALHLPSPTTLTALVLKHVSPQTILSLSLCSTRAAPLYKSAPQTSVLARLVHDTGRYCAEALFASDSTLFGVRGLWNFNALPRDREREREDDPAQSSYGLSVGANGYPYSAAGSNGSSGANGGSYSLISAGAELYYSPISSVVALSTGLRIANLPPPTSAAPADGHTHNSAGPATATPSAPYTLTMTLAPLTGTLTTTYSILASQNVAFSSRFGFNAYSWESEMVAGCEIWRRRKPGREVEAVAQTDDDIPDNLDWARRKLGLPLLYSHPADGAPEPDSDRGTPGSSRGNGNASHDASSPGDSVIKMRINQAGGIRLLWEGKFKELIVSAGVSLGPLGAGGMLDPSSRSEMGMGMGMGLHRES